MCHNQDILENLWITKRLKKFDVRAILYILNNEGT